MMIAQVLEAAMLICFGLSWPINAYKNYKAGTAAGTSWQFILLITGRKVRIGHDQLGSCCILHQLGLSSG